MNDRLRGAESHPGHTVPTKMSTDLGPRKTMIVLVIVVGCFAVLWPKVFYPMLVGSANQHVKPSSIDKTTGCCDVISDTDVNTIKILSELCNNIIQKTDDKPLTGREIISRCRTEVLKTCGIDISEILQEQVRLGRTVTQIIHEIQSLNGSLCLKYNFGVAPWRLGAPHRVTVNFPATNVKQERPLHLRSEIIHPAFRERGRAIPQPNVVPSRPPPRIIEGRPGPIPGMRPTIGGAGHVVPPSQKGTSSMSVIMPIYTIGIVIFFTYTLMKLMFKKQPEGVGGSLYPPVEPDRMFRRDVFESEKSQKTHKLARDGVSSKLVVNAMSALLDEVDQEMENRRKANEVTNQNETAIANGNISNGNAVKVQDAEQEQTSVKVLGMEMTASCEGGQKWSRPNTPIIPSVPPVTIKPSEPPQSIYLEGALPAQSQLLVADSATETQLNTQNSATDPPVVLAGKMTLSVISMDSVQENEVSKIDKSTNDKPHKIENSQTETSPTKNLDNSNEEGEYENDDDEEEEIEYEEEVEVSEEEEEEDEEEDKDADNNAIAEEIIEESKYTTASSTTAAENQISEDKNGENDDEETEEEIEIEEDEEIEEIEVEVSDDEELEENEEANKHVVNHVYENE